MFVAPPPLIEPTVRRALRQRLLTRQPRSDRAGGRAWIVGWDEDGPIRLAFARHGWGGRPVVSQSQRRRYGLRRSRALELAETLRVAVTGALRLGWNGLVGACQRLRRGRKHMDLPRTG